MDLLAVFTTVSDNSHADTLARGAIEMGLAACVQSEAIHSTYRWNGEVVQETEIRLMFKTTKASYHALEALLHELHPYKVPAVFALPVVEASAAYARWVEESLPTAVGLGGA